MTTEEKYAQKIAGLLRKAEQTTPEEAELFLEKAVELMSKYAIEQQMIDAARGDVRDESIVEKRVKYHSSYHHGLYAVGQVIAEVQDCRILCNRRKNESVLYLIGFESDVERAIMLDASVQIQLQIALRAATKRGDVQSEHWMTAMQKFKERRTFMFGFARGLETRLLRVKKAGQDEYKEERVFAGETEDAVATGMSLMVRSRRDKVNDWVDETYGQLRHGRSTRLVGGSSRASAAGFEAGLKADTGSAGHVKQRGVLTR